MDGSQKIISQIHSGKGDNIGRDKYNIEQYIITYQKIAPASLKNALSTILLDLRDRKTDIAKTKLETLKLIDDLDDESKAIIETIYINFNLIENDEVEKSLLVINTFLSNSKNNELRDLCLSAFIRLCCKNNKDTDALDRYNHEKNPGIYTKEAYYELLADELSLEDVFRANKFELAENELTGIIRGGFRVQNSQLSYEAAERLNSFFNTYNSQLLLLFSQSFKLNPIVEKTHYWLCTPELKNELFDIADRAIDLFKRSNQTDYRLFNIAVPLINY